MGSQKPVAYSFEKKQSFNKIYGHFSTFLR